MPDAPGLVLIVDDDEAVRGGVAALLRAVGLDVEAFGSAEAFLTYPPPERPACVILDVRLPGLSGLRIQDELAKAQVHLPVIFVTAHADVPMSVSAMKKGAVEFLTKPFREQELLEAVQLALQQDALRREQDGATASLRQAYETLTPRERDLLPLVASGMMNKQIAAKLGLAEITVRIHRSNLSRKLKARSVADLIRMAQLLKTAAPDH